MKQETFFDINDNELIVSYLHFPVTRNRDFWGKSLIELYDFVLSRIEREKIDINEGHLEYLLLRMSIENGGIFTYLPFNKKVLRGYLSDIKNCFLSDKNSMYSVSRAYARG